METPAGCLQEAVCNQPAFTSMRHNILKTVLMLNFCSQPPASSSWIQVNLGQTRKVTGIVIQGCPQNDYWVTKFKLHHSMDGLTWTDYTADGEVSEHMEV